MRSLATSLVMHGAIETTEAKAKALRPFIERLVTKAKAGTVFARREVSKGLFGDAAVKHLVEAIAPKYVERPGGYTRILKTAIRQGDSAKLAIIEFV